MICYLLMKYLMQTTVWEWRELYNEVLGWRHLSPRINLSITQNRIRRCGSPDFMQYEIQLWCVLAPTPQKEPEFIKSLNLTSSLQEMQKKEKQFKSLLHWHMKCLLNDTMRKQAGKSRMWTMSHKKTDLVSEKSQCHVKRKEGRRDHNKRF